MLKGLFNYECIKFIIVIQLRMYQVYSGKRYTLEKVAKIGNLYFVYKNKCYIHMKKFNEINIYII